MRLIFMGTPQFAVPSLEKILGSSHQVVAVITQPDRFAGRGEKMSVPPVKVLALQNGIRVHQPEKIKEDIWQPTFRVFRADAYIVVAYGKILPRWLLEIPPFGAVNLHASLLPKYRGAAPIQWAIAKGENETGVSTMKLDEGMDTGGILLQEKVFIPPDKDAVDLERRLAEIGADLLLETINRLESGTLKPAEQDPALATYAPSLKKGDGLIRWDKMTAHQIYNRIRAFNPWPGTYTFLNGQILRIWKASPQEISAVSLVPGSLVRQKTESVSVACSSGLLHLIEVQLENRRRTSAKDMVNGLRIPKDQPILLGS